MHPDFWEAFDACWIMFHYLWFKRRCKIKSCFCFASINSKCSNKCCMFARSTTLTAYLLYKLKNTGSKSNISNILGSKMRVLCYIYKNILWVENPSEVLIVNSVQTGPTRRPVCLSIGTHSSLQGGRFAWNATATARAPKKGGETFVVVSPRNTKIHRQSGDVQRRQIRPHSCLSYAARKEKHSLE